MRVTSNETKSFVFESYGVAVRIDGSDQSMIDEGERVARESLLGNLKKTSRKTFDHDFNLIRRPGGTYSLRRNGERIASGRSWKKFFHFLDAMVRVSVGEAAKDVLFMHAGVVAWNGKAIVLPADSFQGKTTLVAELVKCGAEYYSDEFAIFDEHGLVHPFARNLSIRETINGSVHQKNVPVEKLGGTSGTRPIDIGMILMTSYAKGARWAPRRLSQGNGLMEMMPFTLPMPTRPEFSMGILKKVTSRAIIYSSRRGSAEKFAKTLLDFVDKSVN